MDQTGDVKGKGFQGVVLVVDDEPDIRKSLRKVLEYEGYKVHEASGGKEAVDIISCQRIHAILLDIKMPGMDGMDVLKQLVSIDPFAQVIMISGHGTISTAVEAIKLGALDFLEKPLDRDIVLFKVRNAVDKRRLLDETSLLENTLIKPYVLVGESHAIKEIKGTIERIGPTQARVLITGETGVGKGVVARAIHKASKRSKASFVEVSCAAIPEDLIESELLGHEKGAFTGASTRKPGKFEIAHGGTIFLDEIGDMSPSVQAKVLRVIEEGQFERIGGTETVEVDVRIIAATNRDLAKLMKEGKFREDLYYRLNVVPLHIPPLRQRKEDIPLLVEHFVGLYCQFYNLRQKAIEPSLMDLLTEYDWPGNVRELRNTVERMVITSVSDTLKDTDFPLSAIDQPGLSGFLEAATFDDFKKASEKLFIEANLRKNNWNISLTAKKLGMQRSHLYKKIRSLGIEIGQKG